MTTSTTVSVRLQGVDLPVHVVNSTAQVATWLEGRGRIAIDTETTGLNLFGSSWGLRLVQLGDEHEAIVIQIEKWDSADRRALGELIVDHARRHELLFHNATYDRLALDLGGVFALGSLRPSDWYDTRIIAHLLDPRQKQEGGIGHGLKDLSDHFIDADASDVGQRALHAKFAENDWGKNEGWAYIDIDDPDFIRYAGLDSILTARLYCALAPGLNTEALRRLNAFEREVADVCARMQHHGLRIDTDYIDSVLMPHLMKMESDGRREAATFGVMNINSRQQVADALMAMGWEPDLFTPTGSPKVDKVVLETLADTNPLAAAVLKARRGSKWANTYAAPMSEVDANGYIHPSINALQARTGRMSISNPPLQQLPSGDHTIRDAVIADPGKKLWAADYDQVELRVLAAMADERNMKKSIADGVDLHDATAQAIFGEGFNKAQRKIAKTVGFAVVYGGGQAVIARNAGITVNEAKNAIERYRREFPAIGRYSRSLQDRASGGRRLVTTASGRLLPVDGDRLFAATNYVIQSSARDVLAQSLLALTDAGLEPGTDFLLPIHDEILGQVEPGEFAEVADVVRDAMTMDFLGVRLDAAADLIGDRWGDAYR